MHRACGAGCSWPSGKNRFILTNQCYECHSDYGLAGTISARLSGVVHVLRYTTGRYMLPIKIAKPYPNSGCLECHGESQRFLSSRREVAGWVAAPF